MPNQFAKLLSAIFLALILTACSSHQPYPSKWERMESSLSPDGCSALAGVYYADTTGLNVLFGEHFRLDYLYPIYIKISAPQRDVLAIEVVDSHNGNRSAVEHKFTAQNEALECKSDGAELLVSGWYGAAEVFGYSSEKIHLGKDIKGNLIINSVKNGIVFYGVIPLAASFTQWYKFAGPLVCNDKAFFDDQKHADALALHRQRGNDCYWLENYSQAIESYSEAIRLEGKNSSVHSSRAMAWLWKNEYKQAIADFSEDIRIKPQKTFSYNWRGHANFYLGQYELAAADYAESLRLDANQLDIISWNYLALAHAGNKHLAKELLVQHKSSYDRRPRWVKHWSRQLINFMMGDITSQELLEATADDNSPPQQTQTCKAHFYIGESLLLNGNIEEACFQFMKAVNACHKNSQTFLGAQNALRRLWANGELMGSVSEFSPQSCSAG